MKAQPLVRPAHEPALRNADFSRRPASNRRRCRINPAFRSGSWSQCASVASRRLPMKRMLRSADIPVCCIAELSSRRGARTGRRVGTVRSALRGQRLAGWKNLRYRRQECLRHEIKAQRSLQERVPEWVARSCVLLATRLEWLSAVPAWGESGRDCPVTNSRCRNESRARVPNLY
jgi:hypothetical protein